MTTINVVASNARETSNGAASKGVAGQDVDVRVTLPSGEVLDGEVTLLPREDGRGWTAWGDPDNWVSGELLRRLSDLFDGDEFSDALTEIERAADRVIETH